MIDAVDGAAAGGTEVETPGSRRTAEHPDLLAVRALELAHELHEGVDPFLGKRVVD